MAYEICSHWRDPMVVVRKAPQGYDEVETRLATEKCLGSLVTIEANHESKQLSAQ